MSDPLDQPSTVESERIHGEEESAEEAAEAAEGVRHPAHHDEEIEHERHGREAPAPGDRERVNSEGDRGLDGFK